MTNNILYKFVYPLISGVLGGFYSFTLKYFLNRPDKINNVTYAYILFLLTNILTSVILSFYLLLNKNVVLIIKNNLNSLLNKSGILATISIFSNIIMYIALTKVDMLEILPKVGITTYIVGTLSAIIILKERITRLAIFGIIISIIGVYTLFLGTK